MTDNNAPLRAPRTRVFSKVILGVFLTGLAVAGASWVLDLSSEGILVYLGAALVSAFVACAAWEYVERRLRADGGRGVLVWIAFPLAFVGGFAQIPFLGLAAHAPLEDFLFRAGRVEAWIVRSTAGRRLEVWFPRPVATQRGDHNLAFDERPLPDGYYSSHGTDFRWSNEQTLSIAIDPLLAALGTTSLSVLSINADLASDHFHWADGSPIPHQVVPVRSPDER
jgi:hypothetical protein